MSAAYERVRQALEGTPLQGSLDTLNADLHLTPDSPEWVLAALTIIGSASLREDLHAVERRLVRLPETLETALRAAGAEVVRGLADDIASATTGAIKAETIPMMQRIADVMAEHADTSAATLAAAAQDATTSVQADMAARGEAISQASMSLAKAAAKVGGWSPGRISALAAGCALAAGIAVGAYLIGGASRAADVVLGCSTRVEHVGNALHLDPHRRNALRAYVCKG